MAKIETLTAYKCMFEYLQRNNPLKEKLSEDIKAGVRPKYNFENFIDDFCKYTASLIVGSTTERAILLPKEHVYLRENDNEPLKWRIVPYAGKQGKPFRIVKISTGKNYDYNADSAALYEYNVFMYQAKDSALAIFHRQSGSGCKSIFLDVANKMLREKGMRMDMELYIPLATQGFSEIEPTKIQLQYIRDIKTSDIAENIHNKKRVEIIQELGLNLESRENSSMKNILRDILMRGKINQDVAFARIKQACPNAEIYNDAEIVLRIGNRHKRIRFGEFDSALGSYDITERLHEKYKISKNFIGALEELADEYYNSIIAEENADE